MNKNENKWAPAEGGATPGLARAASPSLCIRHAGTSSGQERKRSSSIDFPLEYINGVVLTPSHTGHRAGCGGPFFCREAFALPLSTIREDTQEKIEVTREEDPAGRFLAVTRERVAPLLHGKWREIVREMAQGCSSGCKQVGQSLPFRTSLSKEIPY